MWIWSKQQMELLWCFVMNWCWFTCYLILTSPQSKVKLREPENVILALLAILLLFPVLPLSCFNCDLDQRTISNYLQVHIHLKEMSADLRQMIWEGFFFSFPPLQFFRDLARWHFWLREGKVLNRWIDQVSDQAKSEKQRIKKEIHLSWKQWVAFFLMNL